MMGYPKSFPTDDHVTLLGKSRATPETRVVPGLKRRILHIAPWVALALIGLPAAAQGMNVPQPTHGLMPNPGVGKGMFDIGLKTRIGDLTDGTSNTLFFGEHCGTDLKGTKVGPPFLHPFYVPSHHSDASFQIAVRNGVKAHHWQFGDMAPIPGVSADDVAHITAYVRGQQRRVGIQ